MKSLETEQVAMIKTKVNLKDRSYEIITGNNLLASCGTHIKSLNLGKKILIVTQDKVPKKYLQKVRNSLIKNKFNVFILVLPSGEKYKNLNSFLKILDFAIKNKFERNDSFCGLGGGVITDLTGFAASVYYRGLNYICIPTTLLGMVDAAIGGKTGINLKEGKNLVGSFYQPKIVLIDPTCLKTLPKREFLTGMGEVIKYALIENVVKKKFSKTGFYSFLKKERAKILNLNVHSLLKIISHSSKVKALIVSSDEKEAGIRSVLNLGHTFAHGIEQAYNYKKYTHGEAVSIGICFAGRLAARHNYISKEKVTDIINLVSAFGLPTRLNNKRVANKITSSMLLDKKVKEGRLRLVLPVKKIGNVKLLSGFSKEEIKSLLEKG